MCRGFIADDGVVSALNVRKILLEATYWLDIMTSSFNGNCAYNFLFVHQSGLATNGHIITPVITPEPPSFIFSQNQIWELKE